MPINIESLSDSSSKSNSGRKTFQRASTEIERKANELVSDDATDDANQLAYAESYSVAACPSMYPYVIASSHTIADVDLDVETEALTADLSVDELVQQRKRIT